MPVYPFICEQCNHSFERRLSISQANEKQTCPLCHHSAHRVFQVPSIVFKGSGFYTTDHRKTVASQQDK